MPDSRVAADTCPGEDVPHCHHCGASEPASDFGEEAWMDEDDTSGLACGLICWEEMSDRLGDHAYRFHTHALPTPRI